MAYGLLLLRVVAGLSIAAHGAQKLFGWFGGGGLKGTAGSFDSLGFRPAALMALLAGLGETAGVLFAVGFLTPLAAFAMATVMLNAIESVHWKNGFFNGNGGYEFNLLLLTVAVSVTATGPGRFSLDHALGWHDNLSGLWWGVGVLAAAVAVSLVTTGLLRERTPAV
jgi:putative oxidoreductase